MAIYCGRFSSWVAIYCLLSKSLEYILCLVLIPKPQQTPLVLIAPVVAKNLILSSSESLANIPLCTPGSQEAI